jgi:SAM-dependent methyltransferase
LVAERQPILATNAWAAVNRTSWLLGTSVPSEAILEIGPSYSPIAPKSAGWRTHVVDHASQAELRTKYGPMEVDLAAIEPVDSIWTGGPLHEALPPEAAGSFDRLIASHVIEHIPDLIAFFASAEVLLTPTGVLALAVPDQRHCFDFFKPLTATGDILEAHRLRRSRHGRRTLWNQAAYSVRWHEAVAWGDIPVPDLSFADPFEAAAKAYDNYSKTPEAPYIDCHAWQFTPARFHLVMLELGQLGVLDWHIVDLESSGAEFLCTLRRGVVRLGAATLQKQRMQWLYRGLAETRIQIAQALGDPGVAGPSPRWGAVSMLRRSK